MPRQGNAYAIQATSALTWDDLEGAVLELSARTGGQVGGADIWAAIRHEAGGRRDTESVARALIEVGDRIAERMGMGDTAQLSAAPVPFDFTDGGTEWVTDHSRTEGMRGWDNVPPDDDAYVHRLASDPSEAYGDVEYADPGYNGSKAYPLDTDEHCKTAWRFINMDDHAAKYTPSQLAKIKAAIRAACAKKGIHIDATAMSNVEVGNETARLSATFNVGLRPHDPDVIALAAAAAAGADDDEDDDAAEGNVVNGIPVGAEVARITREAPQGMFLDESTTWGKLATMAREMGGFRPGTGRHATSGQFTTSRVISQGRSLPQSGLQPLDNATVMDINKYVQMWKDDFGNKTLASAAARAAGDSQPGV